ncbi:MAG: GMC family oxidoreductase [Gammaproteobacteria bacterium]
MMHIANELPENSVLAADICIVGAGAAGIVIALQLIDAGLDVILLESGNLGPSDEAQALYAGEVTDERLHSPPDRYRQRRFGGTTTIWGGRCMPFDAIDFAQRDYVPDSGWPFRLQELLPFYPQANQLCEAGQFAYTAENAFNRPLPPMIDNFDCRNFTTNTLERFSCPTDFGARYGKKLRSARNIRVLLDATVTALHLNESGQRVVAASVQSLGGRRFTVQAGQFILAAGGLEVARLLLASCDVQRGGLGNAHDVVGRYYMCHIAGTIGAIKIERPLHAVWHGYDISDEGVYCRRRLALRPEVQREQGIGNFIARLHHPRITDPAHRNAVLSLLFLSRPLIPYEYAKRLHGDARSSWRAWAKHIGNVMTDPFDALSFAWHMLKDRRLAQRKFPSIIIKSKANLYSIDYHAEQQPNRNSRVTLTPHRDPMGVPRINIDWQYTRGDVDTVTRALALLADEFKQGGAGTLQYDPATVEFEMTRYGAYGGHHIGTARMGTDPRTSVTDADCRVHGIDNLYVAGSATFPTSSQANPTLTIVALALRLAARLKRAAIPAVRAQTGQP